MSSFLSQASLRGPNLYCFVVLTHRIVCRVGKVSRRDERNAMAAALTAGPCSALATGGPLGIWLGYSIMGL